MYSPLAEVAQPYTYHRRDKTKSTGSYMQPNRRDNTASTTATAKTSAGATVAQRPAYNERAYSAPHITKEGHQDLEDEEFDDEEVEVGSGDDEDIAGDAFFQQYAAPAAEAEATAAETPAQSEDEDDEPDNHEGPLSPTSNTTRFRPDSVAEPLGSPLSPQPVSVSNL